MNMTPRNSLIAEGDASGFKASSSTAKPIMARLGKRSWSVQTMS
jgi:hypothetical protein